MSITNARLTLFKNLSWSVVSEAIFKVLSFLFILLFSRKFGQEGLGIYTYLFSVVGLVNLAWDLGINSFYYRKWVTNTDEYENDMRVIYGSRFFVIGLSLLVFIPYLVFYERSLLPQLLLVTAIQILDFLKASPSLYFLAKNRFDAVFFINLTERVIAYGGSILAIFLGYGLWVVLWCFFAGKVVAILVAHARQTIAFLPAFTKADIWFAIKSGIPLFLVSFFGTIYFRVDSLMIKHFMSFDALGQYAAAYRLVDISGAIGGVVSGAVFPVLVAVQGEDRMRTLLQKNLKYMTVLATLIALLLVLYAKPAVAFLYGPNFNVAGDALRYLSIVVVFMLFNMILTQQLIASGQENDLLKILAGLVVVNVGLNLYLIPHHEILGAAYSTIICEVLATVAMYMRSNIRMRWSWVPRLAVVIAIAAGSSVFLHWYWMVSAASVGVVFLLLTFVLKVIDLHDFKIKF